MRADRISRTLRVLAAFSVLSLLVGCQIPRGSFGHEPLQTRFAAMAKSAGEGEPKPTPADRYAPPARTASVEPVVLAKHVAPVERAIAQ